MTGSQVDLATLDWEGWASGAGARVKIAAAGGQQVRLFEMGPGFVEPQWCDKGHAGYVVRGEYVTELDGVVWTMRAGQAFILPPGTRHRSRNNGSLPATIFLVDLSPEPVASAVAAQAREQVAE
jgi:quercetin dioxygenase-like cupin family protein